jgi:hypothetical protein
MDFPVALTHPQVQGAASAATRTSLRVLQARGWVAPADAVDDERPAKSASKDEWVAFAGLRGADTSGTKDEIIARLS